MVWTVTLSAGLPLERRRALPTHREGARRAAQAPGWRTQWRQPPRLLRVPRNFLSAGRAAHDAAGNAQSQDRIVSAAIAGPQARACRHLARVLSQPRHACLDQRPPFQARAASTLRASRERLQRIAPSTLIPTTAQPSGAIGNHATQTASSESHQGQAAHSFTEQRHRQLVHGP